MGVGVAIGNRQGSTASSAGSSAGSISSVLMTCEALVAPLNGVMIGNCSGLKVGDVCTAICNPGFVLSVTGDEARVCAQDGRYSGAAPTCVAVWCSPLPRPANGQSSGGCSGAYGGVCIYACDPGYELSAAGDAFRTCM